MYTWVIWLHIVGVLGFVMAHGVSAGAAFALRRERNLGAVRTLLDLSASSIGVLYGSILLLLIAGIAGTFMGNWWGSLWIWISIVLFLVIIFYMYFSPSRFYSQVRKAAGMPYMENFKPHPALEHANMEEVGALLDRSQPVMYTVVGFGGLVIITLLMVWKPF